MEQTSLNSSNMTALEAQIRECFGRVVYSTKTHEKCADLYVVRHGRVKLAQLSLSALTTGGLVTAIFGVPKTSEVAVIVSAILSSVLLIITSYMKEVDLGKQAEKHRQTASELWSVRESYLSLLSDLHDGHIDMDELRSKRDKLQSRLAAIYAAAPRTLDKAYEKAGEGLKEKEELTFSTKEIDAFLPKELHRAEQVGVK